MRSLPISLRSSAVCLGLSGLFVATLVPWHPSIFDRPVDEVVRGFGPWTALHAIGVLGVLLALVGAAGIVAAYGVPERPLWRIGFVVTLVGVMASSALLAFEGIAWPVLAAESPQLLSWDGPLLSSGLLLGAGVLALGWPLGLSLLAVAARHAPAVPRAASTLLALSGPLFLALEGPFVPVAGVASCLLFGGAQIWWATLLWRAAAAP